jgi:His/Glu/Gln/Arg/opine family amino acid ABC transporter permease subunit
MITLDFGAVLSQWPQLVRGAAFTVGLTAVSAVLGVSLGVACGWARAWGPTWLKWIAGAYVELIRNTPFIVQLFFVFFGLPSLGVKLTPEIASVIAMVINLGAYAAEIARAGIEGTALASVIGFIELTKAGAMITNATFKPFTVYACVALMYFALCWPISAYSRRLERKLRREER